MEIMFIKPKNPTQALSQQAIDRITEKAVAVGAKFVMVELLPGVGEEVAIQASEVAGCR
jgi:hypothetical protein